MAVAVGGDGTLAVAVVGDGALAVAVGGDGALAVVVAGNGCCSRLNFVGATIRKHQDILWSGPKRYFPKLIASCFFMPT